MEDKEPDGQLKKINIRQLFRDKNPKLAPYIPGFVYSYLKRILHMDFINSFLEDHGDKKNLEFAKASVKEFNITTEVKGLDRLPDSGRFVFAGNHPLGGFDGMLLISLLGDKYPAIKTLANDLLMNITNMHGIFVPINKHGGQSHEVVRKIDSIFASDDQILTFPAGLVSRRKKGHISDLEWKKNFIVKAREHKRDIVPVWVSGRCTDFFYNLSNFRKFIGIKANLEMFYLPDETYKHRNEHIKVIFGKPIPHSSLTNAQRPSEWAQMIRDLVYRLESNPEADLLSDN